MTTENNIKRGQLLIAEPSIIGDVSFSRSVVLLADHTAEGTLGFILNKPLRYSISELIPEIDASFKVYNGGPVEQDNLYFIHNIPELIPDSVEISDGIYWGGDFELTKNLINTGKVHKENIRFFLGYTGWSPNQLEDELESKSWILRAGKVPKELLSTPSSEFWKKEIIEIGGEYAIWSNAPENPILN